MDSPRRWTIVSLGATILGYLIVIPANGAVFKPNRVEVEYVLPKTSAHDSLYRLVRDRHLLEQIRDLLAPLRLPRRLLLKTEGCDGEINAWYDDGAITVCYEFLDWVWQAVPEQTTPAGVAPIDALAGPIVQIIIHEAGHAAFDLLKIPIFGREEDDADQFSAYIILQSGKEEARRLIAGAAYSVQKRCAVRKSERCNQKVRRRARHDGTAFFQYLMPGVRRGQGSVRRHRGERISSEGTGRGLQ